MNVLENAIEKIPTELAQLSQLSGNELESLPEEITSLPQLRELNLVGNPLKRLPPQLHRLKSLRILFLDEHAMSLAKFIQLEQSMPWVQLVLLRSRHQ